jgi:two-component system cell cycle sensor histidine kinase/response regulator CckA
MVTRAPNSPRRQPKKTIDDHELGAQKQNRAHLAPDPATGADYFEIVTRATNDAVRDWNVSTGALLWPRGLESLLGHNRCPASEKISFWFDHLHPEDLVRVQGELRTAFTGADEIWKGEYRFRHANGNYVHILERGLILRDTRGTAVRLVGTMMDVTTRRQLQAQARRSQRMEAFGQLAGGLAHDFNNFLTTILGYSDLLLSEKGVKGHIADQIKEIRAAAGRASSLTHQLLAFSRRQALESTVLEVNSLINNLEHSLLRLLGDNISIVCHLHHLKKGAYIKGDAGQFAQIILNLAVNARDAMPKGGRLTIETSTLEFGPALDGLPAGADLPVGEYVTIALADNGCGMSEEVKARLFEPFFTTKDDAGNSGLGLATSYGIVRQSGGHICAESEPGKGATFRIYLPRVAAPPPPPYKKPGQKKPLTGTETILVLEDEVSVRHLSVRVLRNLGYEVLEAAHGEDAKRLIAKRNGAPKIDLLLTDMVMPEISGRHFADWLATASPETKVIFISGYLEESMHPGDRRDPGMCFLPKPFSAEELASKVRESLDGSSDR